MSRTATLLAALSLSIVPACGGGEPARRVQLEWSPVGEADVPDPELLTRLEVQDGVAPWRSSAQQVFFEEGAGPEILRGPAPRRFVVDQPARFAECTHVEVEGIFRQPQRLQIFLHDKGPGTPSAGPVIEVPASNDSRSIVFDLSQHARLGLPVDRLSFVASGMGMETQLQAISLLYVSPKRLLPARGHRARWPPLSAG